MPNPVGRSGEADMFDQIIMNFHDAFSTFSHHLQQTQQNVLHKFTTGE